jgi:uncharacterized protein (TIGR04255 family)
MSLPTAISPSPVADTSIEVRFATDVPEDAIFGLVFQKLQEDFPTVTQTPIGMIPAEIRRADAGVMFQPTHRMSGDFYSVAIGGKAISVSAAPPYQGWQTTSEKFRDTFRKIAETGLLKMPTRFGLRYVIDAFNGKLDTTKGFDESLADFLEKAHFSSKTLFFRLLRVEFLKSLSPKYGRDE